MKILLTLLALLVGCGVEVEPDSAGEADKALHKIDCMIVVSLSNLNPCPGITGPID